MELELKLIKLKIWVISSQGFQKDLHTHPYYKTLSKKRQTEISFETYGSCNSILHELGIELMMQ